MVEVSNVTFCYPNTKEGALDSVSMQIQPGECIILCGKSGCGKTTLARFFNGLIPSFFEGEISGQCRTFELYTGKANIEEYVPIVGSVFQNPKTQYFNVDTTAELAFPCENVGMNSSDIQRRVAECARSYGLEHLLDRSIFKLSGGEKQKIAFGAACMLQPKLLVLDEPTSNLDYVAIRELHDMIEKKKSEGTTIIIAEHRLAWIADIADRFCYLEDGKLKGQWKAEEFKKIPNKKLQEMGLRPLDISKYRRQAMEKVKYEGENDALLMKAEHLLVGYGKKSHVYRIEHFTIKKGEIVGLMGSNGVGKSTFAKTICGLLKPLAGEISPVKEKERLKESFMVMQDVNYQLFSDSVKDEVLLGARRPELCEEVLEALNLTEYADKHPMSLSGGQKQRVAIASAMLSGRKMIVLDEPTSGLDYYHMTKVASLLKQLKNQGAAVLVITHDEELVAGWCDRVIYFKDKEN